MEPHLDLLARCDVQSFVKQTSPDDEVGKRRPEIDRHLTHVCMFVSICMHELPFSKPG